MKRLTPVEEEIMQQIWREWNPEVCRRNSIYTIQHQRESGITRVYFNRSS